MAPPLITKRGPPPDPPDAGNRVSKTTTTLNRSNSTAISKARSTPYTTAALHKSSILLKKLGAEQFSTDDQKEDAEMDVESEETQINFDDTDPFEEEFPPLSKVIDDKSSKSNIERDCRNATKHNTTSLMDAIKGLLDLTNPYLKNLEVEHPGVGTDFLALLADGASRAMRGERVYSNLQNTSPTNSKVPKASWAEKTGALENGKVIQLKKQAIRASPPRDQSKEDRRVIIRLGPDHEARKAGSFEIRQQIQQLITDKSLVADVWTVPSGIAILAPTPAKAAALLQFKEAIEKRFGNAKVERQETWVTFIIGPIPKKIRGLDGMYNTMDGLLEEELAPIKENVPIRHIGWTHRSENEEPYGQVRICVPENKADKFPSRLRVFGEAVSIQRIRQRRPVIVCDKCHGFHATRTCARPAKCPNCGANTHDDPCKTTPRCLNCRGPHSSTDPTCPARPRRSNGTLRRPTGAQLLRIRAAGSREYASKNNKRTIDLTATQTSTAEAETCSSHQ